MHSTPLILLSSAAAATGALAAEFCPPLDQIGHAAPEQWAITNLNWTLTRVTSGTWPPAPEDMDSARVSFDLLSDFNDAPVTCTGEGPEFSEEYERQLAGRPALYKWYECSGPSDAVKTEFRFPWFATHTPQLRQKWACTSEEGSSYTMRATGEASISRMIDCTFNDRSKRTQCVSKEGEDTPATAALVKVLEPPPRSCAAASAARPNWKVVDFEWVSGYTPAGFPWPKPVENMTFHIINEALDYSPLMDCTSTDYAGRKNKAPCKIFEANDEDVPLTRYDWDTRSTTLRIDQTWSCEDPSSPNTQSTFHSIGEVDVSSLVSCTTVEVEHPDWNFTDQVKTCVASEIEVKGKLQ